MPNKRNSHFSLNEQLTPTNETLEVVFTPDDNVIKYEYKILKNNKVLKNITVNDELPVSIYLDATGNYKIEVTTYDQYNITNTFNTGKYIIDKDKPYIVFNENSIDVASETNFNIMDGVKAFDKQDGDLISQVTTNYSELDFTTVGLKELTYTVVDSAGNQATSILNVNVYDANLESVYALQILILVVTLIFAIIVARYRRGIKLENRLAKYSINPIEDDSLSLGDQIVNFYQKIIDNISYVLGKTVLITKFGKRYNKYIGVVNDNYSTGLDYVSEKILASFLFVGMAFVARLIQYELISFYDTIIPFIFGFFTPDIIYFFKFKKYRKRLENDFLQAITVMNNAFKSGCSIVQAVELVTNELEGPISNEFQKMSVEISFGLSVDVIFKRFEERIKLEEASYLTAALTILSKTGGNIIQVFSSIEKTLFNKKKLDLELKSLTGSSKIIVILLIGLPIFFVLIVNLINPSYFAPLYTTKIGNIIIGIMLIIYSAYIYIIQKFIKVRI